MRVRLFFCVLCIFLAFSSVCFTGVQQCDARMLLTDADNKVCPVTGDKITEKRFNSSYDGKRYWFSSFDAVRAFDKDPGKYISGKKAKPVTEPDAKVYKKPGRKRWYSR